MTLTMDQMGQNPAFEQFLRAMVGEDLNGTDVSVISMLARLEIDPWSEASDLAAMPEGRARKRLNGLITRFKDVPLLKEKQAQIVSALLGLLPRNAALARPNAPFVAAKLPSLMIGVPLSWYIISLTILGWIIFLAQSQ